MFGICFLHQTEKWAKTKTTTAQKNTKFSFPLCMKTQSKNLIPSRICSAQMICIAAVILEVVLHVWTVGLMHCKTTVFYTELSPSTAVPTLLRSRDFMISNYQCPFSNNQHGRTNM